MQSFGGKNEYFRAVLSLWSYYAVAKPPNASLRSLLFTDDPSFFKDWLKGLPVVYVTLTPRRIKEMRGDIDFLHRIKICIIEEAFEMTDGHLLYVDSDTFFTNDPADILAALDHTTAFMHTREYAFKELRSLPLPSGAIFHGVLKFIEHNVVTLADASVKKISPSLFSWNAGVIGLHKSHIALLPDVHATTTQLYRSTDCHASEQYAFSVVLQENCDVNACDDVVYHYWYRIKKQVIDRFLLRELNMTWLAMDKVTRMARVSEWVARLPRYIANHPFTLRDNAIQAYNTGNFCSGNVWAMKAFLKDPLQTRFFKDFAYHNKRFLMKLIFCR